MEFIQTEWQVKVEFNKVYVVGTAPNKNNFISQYIERAMITKAIEYIDKAKKVGECIILSEEPKGLIHSTNNNTISVYFSVMFKSQIKADEYAYAINK